MPILLSESALATASSAQFLDPGKSLYSVTRCLCRVYILWWHCLVCTSQNTLYAHTRTHWHTLRTYNDDTHTLTHTCNTHLYTQPWNTLTHAHTPHTTHTTYNHTHAHTVTGTTTHTHWLTHAHTDTHTCSTLTYTAWSHTWLMFNHWNYSE